MDVIVRSVFIALAFVSALTSSHLRAQIPGRSERVSKQNRPNGEPRVKGISDVRAPEVSLIVDKLRDHDPKVRADAAFRLHEDFLTLPLSGSVAEMASDALSECLVDPDRHVRLHAGIALSTIEPISPKAIPALLKLAENDNDKDLREIALRVLGKSHRASEALISVLTKGLKDTDPHIREICADAIGEIGPTAASAIRPLIVTLSDESRYVRISSAQALARVEHAHEALGPLVEALSDRDATMRLSAAYAIGSIGPSAKPRVDRLRRMLVDQDSRVRCIAAFSIWKIDNDSDIALRILVKALEDPDFSIRALAAHLLADMGTSAKPAISALAKALKDDSPDEVSCVAVALGRLGRLSIPTISALILKVDHENPLVRIHILQALIKIDPTSRDVLRIVYRLSKHDPDASVRCAARNSILLLRENK